MEGIQSVRVTPACPLHPERLVLEPRWSPGMSAGGPVLHQFALIPPQPPVCLSVRQSVRLSVFVCLSLSFWLQVTGGLGLRGTCTRT